MNENGLDSRAVIQQDRVNNHLLRLGCTPIDLAKLVNEGQATHTPSSRLRFVIAASKVS